MSSARWSDIVAAIVKDGGPITPHPDAETVRLLAERERRIRAVTEYDVTRLEPALDLDEEPPAPIPARPYAVAPNPPTRRGWRRLFRRAA